MNCRDEQVVRNHAKGRWQWDGRETPREILVHRYASGEITRERYEEMKRTLATPFPALKRRFDERALLLPLRFAQALATFHFVGMQG